jgi:hypothetical protein
MAIEKERESVALMLDKMLDFSLFMLASIITTITI